LNLGTPLSYVAHHFFAVIVWVVIALVKKVIRETGSSTDTTEPNKEGDTVSKDIVKCEQCEVHVLKSEAFSVNGQYYCSKAHLPDNPSSQP